MVGDERIQKLEGNEVNTYRPPLPHPCWVQAFSVSQQPTKPPTVLLQKKKLPPSGHIIYWVILTHVSQWGWS